jgi:hypothetical protein
MKQIHSSFISMLTHEDITIMGRARAFLPSLHIGHTPNDARASSLTRHMSPR